MWKPSQPALLMIIVALHCHAALADEPPPVSAVEEAWKQRSKDLSSSLLQWTEERIHPGGQRLSPHDAEPLASDLTIVFEKRLIISGEKFRIEGVGKALDYRTKALEPFELTIVCNETGSSFHNYPDRKNNLGYFAKSSAGLADVTYRPAMLATNPGDPNFGQINLDEYHVTPGQIDVAGRSCITLESNTERSLEGRLYLDPERQFVITRIVSADGNRISRQIDFTYDRDSEGVWYPASWEFKIMNPTLDGFALLLSGTTKDFNSKFIASTQDFEIHYPPGTLIYDLRTPGDNRIVIEETGSMRNLDQSEHRTPIENLLTPEQPPVSTRTWILLANLAGILAISTVLLYRYYKRRRKQG